MRVSLATIKPSGRPIRTTWDEEKMTELAQSIKEQGLIVPVKVRPVAGLKECVVHGLGWLDADGIPHSTGSEYELCFWCSEAKGEYWNWDDETEEETTPKYPALEIVYGHRRVEAARRAGLMDVEAIIEGVDDTNALVQALIENLQREDMNPLDKGRALAALKQETGWSHREMQRRGIMGADSIDQYIALLYDPQEVQTMVEEGVLPELTIRKLRRANLTGEEIAGVAGKVVKEGLNAAQARQIADAISVAPTDQVKNKLLEWEYSPAIHDPDLIKSRAKEYGVNDPMFRQDASPQQKQWAQTPEVAAAVTGIIEGAKRWQTLIEEIRKMVEIGKMAPESRRFIAHRVRQLADTLAQWADELEE